MDWMIAYQNRNVFLYCPLCSARALKVHKQSAYVCTECGLEFYLNTAAAVVALIEDPQHRLVITVRDHKPKEGMLDLPGGFVNPGESAEEAIRREVEEEVGLQVERTEYFGSAPNHYLYKGVHYATEDIAFVCRVSNWSALQTREEIRSILLLRADEIDLERFAFDSVLHFLRLYLQR
jgi:ADP-ribose pyrophosphatase YjhB (NUDIX family)